MSETNRVLNFSEFGKKYSQDSENDIAASYSEFSSSADNFQEAFDDDTYEDGQTGPKRPIASGSEETPAEPSGFNQEEPDEMQAPEYDESEEDHIEDEEIESEESDEDEDHIEDEESDEADEDEDEEWDEEEYGDPEEDEDDEDEDEEEDDEEETNESYSYLVESFEDYTSRSQPRSSEYDSIINSIEFEDDHIENDGKCFVICKSCGSEKEIEPGHIPFGKNEEDNPDSWWQGASMGMQCGCNM